MKTRHLTFILGIAFLLPAAHAQVPGALDTVDRDQQQRGLQQSAKRVYNTGDRVAEAYEGESSDTGEQIVFQPVERPTYFEASADIQYYYTDNMFLSERERQEAGVLASTVQFALAPKIRKFAGGELAPRLGYRHQWFDYGLDGATLHDSSLKLDSYDFNAQTFFADARWTRGGWAFSAGLDYARLLTTSAYNEFYNELVPRWGAQRAFRLDETTALTVGYEGDYRFTELRRNLFLQSDYNDRTDHGVYLSLTKTFGRHALLQPYYRFKYTAFTADGVDREDCLNTVGVAFYWFFTPQISARVFANYDLRNSSAAGISEYCKLDTGVGLNLTFRF